MNSVDIKQQLPEVKQTCVIAEDVFELLRNAILTEEVKPTFMKMQVFQINHGTGENNQHRRSFSQYTFDRMIRDGDLMINPKYTHARCGLRKYLLVDDREVI